MCGDRVRLTGVSKPLGFESAKAALIAGRRPARQLLQFPRHPGHRSAGVRSMLHNKKELAMILTRSTVGLLATLVITAVPSLAYAAKFTCIEIDDKSGQFVVEAQSVADATHEIQKVFGQYTHTRCFAGATEGVPPLPQATATPSAASGAQTYSCSAGDWVRGIEATSKEEATDKACKLLDCGKPGKYSTARCFPMSAPKYDPVTGSAQTTATQPAASGAQSPAGATTSAPTGESVQQVPGGSSTTQAVDCASKVGWVEKAKCFASSAPATTR